MKFSLYVLAAAIGGILSTVLYPLFNYFIKRGIIRGGIKLYIDGPIINSDYSIHSIRVVNKSPVTLKNVIAFVSIDYNESDIKSHPVINTYTAFTPLRPLMLSWAKVIDDKNLPHIDINQAEVSDLNVIRFYPSINGLQIASESGFSQGSDKKGRVLLSGNRSYAFEILITADNSLPRKRKFIFDQKTKTILPDT